MKQITQEQFDGFPVVDGVKQCPAGDYSLIKSFGERCSFGEGCKATSPFWGFQYEPPFETDGTIYPPVLCREFWEEKLGVKLTGCYGEIKKTVAPMIPELLKRDGWSKCEKRIIESWI